MGRVGTSGADLWPNHLDGLPEGVDFRFLDLILLPCRGELFLDVAAVEDFAAFTACSLSTILANAWPYSAPDGLETEGLARRAPKELSLYVWIYCLICWLVQDGAKVATYKVLQMFKGEEGDSETMLVQAAREQERAAAGAAAVEVV